MVLLIFILIFPPCIPLHIIHIPLNYSTAYYRKTVGYGTSRRQLIIQANNKKAFLWGLRKTAPSKAGWCCCFSVVSITLQYYYYTLRITLQAIFFPALPAGWEWKSSGSLCMTTVRPILSDTENRSVLTDKYAFP